MILSTSIRFEVRLEWDGTVVLWIGEDLDPFTVIWLARRILDEWHRPRK
jgi:hypothetical protein